MSKLKILFLFLLVLIIANCSTKKNLNTGLNKTSDSTFTVSDEIYVDKKHEKIDFFPSTDTEKKWVDSIYNQFSLEEKIGQLFMVAAYSNKDEAHALSLDKLIEEYKIGGLIFFQGGPKRQAKLTNRFQSKSKTPLFIGIDAEWGLAMRLDSTYKYPWNMTLGAIKDLNLIKKVGQNMAQESKRLGVQFNFAPVLDINTNPLNPIIGNRSFGEDKFNVTDHAIALMTGFQSNGVFSTGKHFPGHGDTSSDSHHALPLIDFPKSRLDKIELYPYKQLFNQGLVSVMVAHLNIPSLEPKENIPSTTSYSVVTSLLQKELGFEGLIFTDALNMKAASKYLAPGDLDLQAFLAGNDVLLFPENVPLAIDKIKNAVLDNRISLERLEFSVKKILKYKYKAGLNKYKAIDIQGIDKDLMPSSNDALQYQLYENATTLLKNKSNVLPIKNLNQKIAYVKFGDDSNDAFVSSLQKYIQVNQVFHENLDTLNAILKNYNTVIIGYHKSDKAWKKHDFTPKELLWIQEIAKNHTVILDAFTKPYSLQAISNFDNIEAVIMSYQNADIAQEVAAQLIFGAIQPKGKLPVTINPEFHVNHGLEFDKLNRLGFTAPENVGMDPKILNQIDQVAENAIAQKMTPGIQVLVARKGKVIYQKSFGYKTYENIDKINNNSIFDVASVTKIAATLPITMQLFDQNKFELDSKLGDKLPIFQNSNKQDINFKDLLSHQAQLQAWIPFYKETLDSINKPSYKFYKPYLDQKYNLQVAENLYLDKDYQDTIFKKIIESNLLAKKEYKYSDLTFIILKKYIENTTNNTLNSLVQDNFFTPLGMYNTTFNPLQKFDAYRIVPTEIDNYFRYTTIQGYVHDMAAAMQGGVAGHAGLFSNSLDLAKIMQMYLQKGTYGNTKFFSTKTFDTFNTCHFCPEKNRRGLGFDKPQLAKEGPTCGCVSAESFGHTGFTGTMVWADPKTEIIYIFLSNRTYPNSNATNKLSKENIRENIQKIIQNAIIN